VEILPEPDSYSIVWYFASFPFDTMRAVPEKSSLKTKIIGMMEKGMHNFQSSKLFPVVTRLPFP
jgi:hypothetical protein